MDSQGTQGYQGASGIAGATGNQGGQGHLLIQTAVELVVKILVKSVRLVRAGGWLDIFFVDYNDQYPSFDYLELAPADAASSDLWNRCA